MFIVGVFSGFINPLHSNVSVGILRTVLFTFQKVLGEFVKKSGTSQIGDHFCYSHDLYM